MLIEAGHNQQQIDKIYENLQEEILKLQAKNEASRLEIERLKQHSGEQDKRIQHAQEKTREAVRVFSKDESSIKPEPVLKTEPQKTIAVPKSYPPGMLEHFSKVVDLPLTSQENKLILGALLDENPEARKMLIEAGYNQQQIDKIFENLQEEILKLQAKNEASRLEIERLNQHNAAIDERSKGRQNIQESIHKKLTGETSQEKKP